MDYFAFAVSTLPAMQSPKHEPVYRCAMCSTVVMSDRGAVNYPFCSDECAVQASAENDDERL